MGVLGTVMNVFKTERRAENLPVKGIKPGPVLTTTLAEQKKSITVGGLVASLQPRMMPVILLGACADGLPFMIDLADPHLGAILISCDQGAGKTHQLQVMAESAARLNKPSRFQIGVLTFKPAEWQSWERTPDRKKYLQGIFAWYDPWAEAFIHNLVELAESRQAGQRTGAQILLILDDLNFIEELSYEAQVNLHWLMEYGSQVDIWVTGAINAHQAEQMHYWIDPFRTRIIGKTKSKETADMLTLRCGSAADGLDAAHFKAWTGTEWCTYRLPLLGD